MVLGAARPEEAIANALWGIRIAQPTKTILLVEGDDDDRFFTKHVDLKRCHIRAPYGRPRVLRVLEELRLRSVDGVLAVLDTDYDRLLGSPLSDPDVVTTDAHDIETMLLMSPAFDHVLIEFGDRERIANAEQAAGKSARDILLTAGAPIGAARLACARNGWHVSFDGIPYEKFVDVKTLKVSGEALYEQMRGRQARALEGSRMPPDAEHSCAHELCAGHPLTDLCQGHDLVGILGLALQRLFGQRLASDVHPERLGTALRLAFDDAAFANTQLAHQLQSWRTRNPRFHL